MRNRSITGIASAHCGSEDRHRILEKETYCSRTTGSLRKPSRPWRLIDLFCGAGGMTLGFTKTFGHHFEPVWANDFDTYCYNTYTANLGAHCECGDIIEILSQPTRQVPQADVVVGGPPCQGFSLLNKNRIGDVRKELWRPYLEVVERSGARVFVIENVPQLLGSREHGQITKTAERLGFKVVSAKLCAADYGVAQTRIRAFILGSKIDGVENLFPPRKSHFNPARKPSSKHKDLHDGIDKYLAGAQPWCTVRDAVGDLPAPRGTQVRDEKPPLDLHFGRSPTELSLQRYRAIPKEGMNRFDLQRLAPHITPQCWIRKTSGGTDLFGRLWWNRPAVTMRTEFYKPEKGRYLHPEQDRPITHREAARFQSFPDTFSFKGTKSEIAKQIGNAVPPLLAARIADIVHALLSTHEKG